ncbi:MAG: hypothetical protein ACREON_03750 [Gemmatimonadaceae bacterium]
MIVFVNSRRLEVAQGATALDAVRAWSEEAVGQVADGSRIITDDRGLPVLPETPVHGGSIFRVIAARRRDGDDDLLH